MIMIIVGVLMAIAFLVVMGAAASVRVVQQYERGIVFRFGRVRPRPAAPASP